MSEKTRKLAAGGKNRPSEATNGAAAPAPAEKDTAARRGADSQGAEAAGNAPPKESPPASPPRRQVKAKARITAKVAPAGNTPGNGKKPAKSESETDKDASEISLQFSSPSSDPPAQRGLKPDPEKVRRARQESQLKLPESAPASRRAATTASASATIAGAENGDTAMSSDSEQQMAIPAAARLSGAIKSTRPTNQRLFRRHRRGLSLTMGLLVVTGIVWWSGAFQKRTDLANTTDPAEIAEPTPLETAAARPNDEEVRSETEKLLSDLGLFTQSANEGSDDNLEAAIRNYQAMAGLPVNGEPSYDLLMDLRAVASAIGTR